LHELDSKTALPWFKAMRWMAHVPKEDKSLQTQCLEMEKRPGNEGNATNSFPCSRTAGIENAQRRGGINGRVWMTRSFLSY